MQRRYWVLCFLQAGRRGLLGSKPLLAGLRLST